MKQTWLRVGKVFPLLAILSSASANADVIITEYIEGGGNNKAIEISNLGNASVDLAGYQLIKFSNGTDSQASYDYSGNLAAGASLVIYNSSALDPFKTAAGAIAETSIVQHNGNDQFTLNKDGAVVDSIGQYLNTANFAKDVTLRRNNNITEGDADFTDAWTNADWFSAGKDVADGLGCSGVDACSAVPVDPEEPEVPVIPTGSRVIISEIVNGTNANKVIEISNIGDADIDLAENQFKLHLYRDAATWPSEQVYLQGNLVAASSLVVYNSAATDNFKKDAPQGLDAADVASFDGNDAIVLLSGSGETVVDSFGQIGANQIWLTADFSSATATLRRKNSIVSGDSNATNNFSSELADWHYELQDTFDGLGCHGESACTGAESMPTAGTALISTACFNCPDLGKVADMSTYIHDSYYATALAAGLNDKTAFRAALTQDISANYTQLSYGEVWTALTHTDEDPEDSDNVILLYSGRSIFKDQNASGDHSSNLDYWNREHVWAKSHGFPSSSQKGYTDIHHLRPADVSINSLRSNLDFANGGSAIEEAPENSLNPDISWEPRDEVKGDVARMVLYMDVRYEMNEAAMPDLVLIDQVGVDAFENEGDPVANLGKLCDLLTWHAADPVNTFEQARNNAIYEYQGNRNPFIDHPEWVATAFENACVTEVNPIGFAVKNNVALSTLVTSEVQTLTGIASPLTMSIVGGEYSIGCTGAFTSVATTVNNDDTLCLQHTSSDSYSSTVNTAVTIGEAVFNFSSLTIEDPSPVIEEPPVIDVPEEPANEHPSNQTPGPFSMSPIHNTDLSSTMVSGIVIVTGIQQAVAINVSEGSEYSIGCNNTFTFAEGSVSNGDFICVRHISSSEYATQTTTTLNINGVKSDFISTTKSETYDSEQLASENSDDDDDELSGLGGLGYLLLLLPGVLILRTRKKPALIE